MPDLSPLSLSIWYAGALAQAALLIYMGLSGAWRRWPSLFAFLWILTARGIIGMAEVALWHSAAVYFWSYWIGSLAALAAEVFLIVELGVKVTGASSRGGRIIATVFPTLCFVYLGLMLSSCRGHRMPAYGQVVCVVTCLYKAIGIAWLLAALTGYVCAELVAQWSGAVRWVAAGFLVEATAAAAEGWLSAEWPAFQSFLSQIKGCLWFISIGAWAWSMRPRGRSRGASIPGGVARAIGMYFRFILRNQGSLRTR